MSRSDSASTIEKETGVTLPCTASRLIAASLLLTLFCAGTFAQQTPPDATPSDPTASGNKPVVTWAKEPDVFMGIKFGESFAAQVPECPKAAYGYDSKAISASRNRCFRTMARARENQQAHFFLENSPDIGFKIINVLATGVNGDFEGLSFVYGHSNYHKVIDLFRARYGEPTSVDTVSFQTTGGASLIGNVDQWQGKNITIMVWEYGTKRDEGFVTVSTKKLIESRGADAKNNAERNKDKL